MLRWVKVYKLMLSRAQWGPILFSCQVRLEVSFLIIEVLLIIGVIVMLFCIFSFTEVTMGSYMSSGRKITR